MNHYNDIFDFVTGEVNRYEKPIELTNGWSWSMKQHLRRSFLYLNSQFEEQNENRELRPNKNVVLPIMNIQFRTEGFDVKDITLYVDNPDKYYQSLLVKKYHQKWALENAIDTFIDEMVQSYCTYGGVLVRKTEDVKPEVIKLRNLAFCNQTNILAYPFAIRHMFSAAQLRQANKKWGQASYGATIDIETLIALAKKEDKDEIEVFEVHGLMPTEWLGDEEHVDENSKDVNQVQIVSYFTDQDKQKRGVALFRKRYPDVGDFFKFYARDEVEDRALGRGGVEELFEPQMWTNQNEVWVAEMLNAASKTLFATTDATFKSRNNLKNVDNGEVLILKEGGQMEQVNTYPRNLAVFNDAVARWQEHAQRVGAASDGQLGETPTSGTPFKLYEAQNIEARSMHRHRQGQLAVFMDEIYRDWILPHLTREITNEQTFMDELSIDEMQEVVEKVTTKKVNQFKKNMILSGQEVDDGLVEDYKMKVKEDVMKKGNKRFFKILKDEMKDAHLSVRTSIAGKQKNLALMTDKLVGLVRQYLATPQLRQDPMFAKLLSEILESSGLSPLMFGSIPQAPQMAMAQAGGSTQPLQQFGQTQDNQEV